MTGRVDALTPVEVLTLAAISDRPRYGYELVKKIAELSDGRVRVRPGNLYRVLHRLESRGLAQEATGGVGHSGQERRQYFGATPSGRRAAAEQLAMYGRVLDQVPGLRGALGDA